MTVKFLRFFLLFLLTAVLVADTFFIINVLAINKETDSLNYLVTVRQKSLSTPEVSLIAVGDIMLSRAVDAKMRAQNDYNYPFLETRDYLKQGDVVFGNLETAITPGRAIETGEMSFRADPGVEVALKDAGFNILSLANNHTPNFGQKGLKDTFNYLAEADIQYVGAGRNSQEAYGAVYLDKEGITFAFLAYNDSDVVPDSYFAGDNWAGTAYMDIEKMKKSVASAKEQADFVIVSMHSGNEYIPGPNNNQTNFAHAAINAGAEMVIGHHPHVVQTMEEYNGKLIFYSLGNFVFDQMWSHETRQGLMIKAIFNSNGINEVEFTPVLIEDYVQPVIVEDSEADSIIDRLKFPQINNQDGVYLLKMENDA